MMMLTDQPAGPEPVMRLLLVEDDEDHAQIIFRTLMRQKSPVVIAHVRTGLDALAYLRAESDHAGRLRPDLILMDLKLPCVGGHEVLEALKADQDLLDIPVVVLTTSDAESDMKRAYRNHANSYLVKPVDAAAFRQMIESLSQYWGVWNRAPLRTPH